MCVSPFLLNEQSLDQLLLFFLSVVIILKDETQRRNIKERRRNQNNKKVATTIKENKTHFYGAKKYGEKMHLLFFLVVVICWCHWICTFGRANWVWGRFFHFKQSVGSKYYMLMMMMTTKSVCTYVHIQHGHILPSHILREFLLFYLCDDGMNQQRKKNSKWQKDLTNFFALFFSSEIFMGIWLLTIK